MAEELSVVCGVWWNMPAFQRNKENNLRENTQQVKGMRLVTSE